MIDFKAYGGPLWVRLAIACATALPIGALIGLVVTAGATARLDRPTPAPVVYTLSFPDLSRGWMHVEVEFPRVMETLQLRMSRSSPGRYALHEFAKNVRDLVAFDGQGRQISVNQRAPHMWDIRSASDRVRVRYRVSGERLDGTHLAIDATHAHVNIPAALIWAEGRELDPVRVRIEPPAALGWRVATQLFPTADPFVFTAPNLSYLVDSPIEVSSHVRRAFVADPPPDAPAAPRPTIVLALHHAGSDADAERYLDGVRRTVREQASIFGEYPRYEQQTFTFIADYLPSAAADGMEHRDSAVLTDARSIARDHVRLLSLAAHEFFHGWNVERIRPRSLEPFNLLDANASGELWLAEGFTDYYEALTMARSGLGSLEDVQADLGDAVSQVMTSPAMAYLSAVEMSRLAPLRDGAMSSDRRNWNTVVSHYTYGAALALGFDFTLRDRSANARSLDDFMRAMWIRHGRPSSSRIGFVDAPYTLDDVRDRLAEVSGDPAMASELMDRFVLGRETMDYARLVARAGLRLRPKSSTRASLGAISVHDADGRVRLASPPPSGSPAALAGLSQGDAILAIGPRSIARVVELAQALAAHRPGDRVTLQFERRSGARPSQRSVRLVGEPGFELLTVEAAGGVLSPREQAFRQAWLSPKFTTRVSRAASRE